MQFIATGVSMLPTYKPGDALKVNILNRNICVGDIIVFKSDNDNLIAHRVLVKRNGIVITKGDNFIFYDPPVLVDNIIGIVENNNNLRPIINNHIEVEIIDEFKEEITLEKSWVNVLVIFHEESIKVNQAIYERPVNSNNKTRYYICREYQKKPFNNILLNCFDSVYLFSNYNI